MQNQTISPYLFRQLFMLGLIVVFGILIIEEMLPYLSGVLGALTLHIIFKDSMVKMVQKGIKPGLAATIIMIISLFIIIIPISLMVQLIANKLQEVVANSEAVTRIVKTKIGELESHLGLDLMANIQTNDITSWVSQNVQGLVGSTFNVFMALSIMYFLLYYMLINTESLRKAFRKYIPLSDTNMDTISKETRDIVKSNAIGIPLVALMQGVVALVGYLIFGVEDAWFWFVVTFIGSMIPFVGTALGIVPVTILLFANGDNFAAIGILIYGITVVGVTDNIFRIIIQNKLAHLHPLITLIGVIIGVPLFGFIGLIFGPLLLSLFLLLVKIYQSEYGRLDKKVR